MVAAISFVEAPLRFRAPGVTLAIGLGIGRRVFAALNRIEVVLAAVVVPAAVLDAHPLALVVAGAVAVAALAAQLVAVRPFLTRRSDRVLAGETDGPRSHAHFVYVGLEVVKIGALAVLAVVALT
ncbi:MAG TPA: hypothetical protein VGH76_03400 [Actinomycetospora sp.]|jgi:hypothetical protein